MYNLRNNKPESVIRKLKFDKLHQANHRRVVVVGSGESGYLAFNKMSRVNQLRAFDIGLASKDPIHRTRFGSLFYSLNYYQQLDFEVPLIGSYRKNRLGFDEIVAVDPHNSRLLFPNRVHIDYDYLVLACGREIDSERFPTLLEISDEPYNDLYNADTFHGYKKLKARYSSLFNGMKFNVVIMRESQSTEACINLALILKKRFPASHVSVYAEESQILPNSVGADGQLIRFLQSSGIEVIVDTPLSVDVTDGKVSMVVGNGQEIGREFVFFSPTKRLPRFLQSQASLAPSNFCHDTLVNRDHPTILGIGSFLFPNSSLPEKSLQADCLAENIQKLINKDWFEASDPLSPWQRDYAPMVIFNDFSKVVLLNKATGEMRTSLWGQKKAAWKLLNSDMLKYFHLLRYGFPCKKLFRFN